VKHSAALEKLFTFLDQRIRARLPYVGDAVDGQRMAMAREMVKETLSSLVDSVSVDEGQYLVRFRLSGGGRSPWVMVPAVYGPTGSDSAAAAGGGPRQDSRGSGFRASGRFEPAGPFYYDGPENGASLKAAEADYDAASLYWKD
jgi:hypothetical protein